MEERERERSEVFHGLSIEGLFIKYLLTKNDMQASMPGKNNQECNS